MTYPFSLLRRRRGFNLIEAAIVLGVIGLVIGGIWIAAASVSEKNRVRRTVEMILVVTDEVRRQYRPFLANYPDATSTLLAGTSATASRQVGMPADFINADGSYRHFWGGQIRVYLRRGISNPPHDRVEIQFRNFSNRSACTQIAMMLGSVMSERDDLAQIIVDTAGAGLNTFPITLQQADSQCAGGGGGGFNQLDVNFAM